MGRGKTKDSLVLWERGGVRGLPNYYIQGELK